MDGYKTTLVLSLARNLHDGRSNQHLHPVADGGRANDSVDRRFRWFRSRTISSNRSELDQAHGQLRSHSGSARRDTQHTGSGEKMIRRRQTNSSAILEVIVASGAVGVFNVFLALLLLGIGLMWVIVR